jgi:mono/diheme cytochrome c family protein
MIGMRRAAGATVFLLGVVGGSAGAAGTETKGRRVLYLRNCAECHGLDASMPHFRSAISAAEVKSIVDHLRKLDASTPVP